MKARGQTLVIFALFLTVLIGVSALAIDYANWLLTDRKLQNISDHAALAGASVFNQNVNNASCAVAPGQQLCIDARVHAWTSLNQELFPGVTLDVACLAANGNTPQGGWTDASDASCPAASFQGHTLWVSTPPPANPSYTGPGIVKGALAGNYGIVWVRVDRPTQTFLSGIFGITARDRIGWATAGVLPNDFALQIFCRDGANPAGNNSGCVSKGVGIEGGGGIEIVRGDIGSNQSLQVTQQGGSGVVLRSGNVFLLEGVCGPSTWNCPPQNTGGISDGTNAKNAFYIPPQPVPHYESPIDYATLSVCPTTQAAWDSNPVPCVPYWPSGAGSPGDWTCSTSDPSNYCGTPDLTADDNTGNRAPHCDARTNPNAAADAHLLPYDDLGNSTFRGSQYSPQNIYRNIEDSQDPSGTLNAVPNPTTLTGTPTNWVYSPDGDTTSYRVAIQPPNGIPDPGNLTVRYVLFKTDGGAIDPANGGNAVNVTVQLQELVSGAWVTRGADSQQVATGDVIAYQHEVPASAVVNYSALSLKITVATQNDGGGQQPNERGAGISWAEVETTNLSPALPPMIPPGYYHSITIPDNGCAILDPTGSQNGLKLGQLAGVYRFGPNSSSAIALGQDALLIGDGVTLVFDTNFPDPTGGRGIALASRSALMLNTYIPGGYNPSTPLSALPQEALAAGWAIDPTTTAGIYQGESMWGPAGTGTVRGVCTDDSLPKTACIVRGSYSPITTPVVYRGITFYFTNNWPATTIRDRYQMSGSSGNEPGIAFRGILYAPYDDVKLTGGNGFNTIGQILSWTAKFAGQSTIFLDYPYARCEQTNSCLPYLLEPTVNQ